MQQSTYVFSDTFDCNLNVFGTIGETSCSGKVIELINKWNVVMESISCIICQF